MRRSAFRDRRLHRRLHRRPHRRLHRRLAAGICAVLGVSLAGCASDAPSDSRIVQVVAGLRHSCALFDDGSVSCWGQGKLPARVAGLTGGMLALAAGTDQTCGITAERQVRCWGAGDLTVKGEDGKPLGGVTTVALGPSFGCASNADGTFCWGKNERGQLARPLEFSESDTALLAQPGPQRFLGAGQAVVVHDGADRLCSWGHNGTHQITRDDVTLVYTEPQCGIVRNVAQLSVGADHTCLRHPDGGFECWGERYYGQLGLGGTVDDTLDVPPYGRPTRLAAAVRELVAGASHTCALLEGGAVTCFGLNSKGQVGPGATTTAEEVRDPAPVTGFSGPVTALGSGASAQHTCALVGDRGVQCWGSNSEGQLGDGASPPDPTRFSHGPVSVRF